jgi:hypothetical protein
MKIAVIGPHCYGIGRTIQQALARARVNRPTFYAASPMPYNAYRASEDVEVDGMGNISATILHKIREVRYRDGQKIVRLKDFLGDPA